MGGTIPRSPALAHIDQTTSNPLSQFLKSIRRSYARVGKRLLDLIIASLLLPILVPLIIVLWGLTRYSGGAGFFGHTRIGRNGKEFECWKIRTMAPDADAMLNRYLNANPAAAEEWQRTQKLHNDPRVTALGLFLRRTSLDELPQVWNVLRGDMSLVGPRPVTQSELARYGTNAQIYLNLRPGITGLWQVKGRSNGCYDERLQMDCAYARTIGLVHDLSLMARTSAVIFRPTGR